jgi:uncharacterized membrane protein YhaH (DUF805 family)
MENYIAVLKKYAIFNGRAGRTEYWMFILFSLLVSIVLGIFDKFLFPEGVLREIGILGSIYSLAVLLPSLAVSVRRLHDTNRSGWWLLLILIPVIGFIVLLVFFLEKSTSGENKYGSNSNGISENLPPANPTI